MGLSYPWRRSQFKLSSHHYRISTEDFKTLRYIPTIPRRKLRPWGCIPSRWSRSWWDSTVAAEGCRASARTQRLLFRRQAPCQLPLSRAPPFGCRWTAWSRGKSRSRLHDFIVISDTLSTVSLHLTRMYLTKNELHGVHRHPRRVLHVHLYGHRLSWHVAPDGQRIINGQRRGPATQATERFAHLLFNFLL